MKKILQLAFLALTLTPFAQASFYEGFDGDTFPDYWSIDPEFGGSVDWQMGGGVATTGYIDKAPLYYTPFIVNNGEDFVFRVRAGWDDSPITSMTLGLGGYTQFRYAAFDSEWRNGSRVVRAYTHSGGPVRTVEGVAPGWHDFEISYFSRTLRFKLDGQEILAVPNWGGFRGTVDMRFANRGQNPSPPMYIDYIDFQSVPEPASLTAVAMGLAFIWKRKGIKR